MLSARRGFTLVELLIGVILTGLVGAAALSAILHFVRMTRSLDAMLAVRRTVRDAAELLEHDVRGAAPDPPAGAFYQLGDDLLDIRLLTGASVICAIDSDRRHVRVPPLRTGAQSLTSWVASPEAGDTVLVYRSSADPDRARWLALALARAPERGTPCPAASSFAEPTGASESVVLEFTTTLDDSIAPGAALRFVRRTRYERYRASDGAWYLGLADCLASRATPCTTVQPVAGPFAAAGIQFVARDSLGVVTTNPASTASIGIALRAVSRDAARAPGWASGPTTDSLRITVTPRN